MTAQDISVVPLIAGRVYLLNKHVVAVGKTREILTNVELLRKNGLDAPGHDNLPYFNVHHMKR